MITIYMRAGNRVERKDMNTLWAANLMAYKFVNNWGWEQADVVDNRTGEILRTYIRG